MIGIDVFFIFTCPKMTNYSFILKVEGPQLLGKICSFLRCDSPDTIHPEHTSMKMEVHVRKNEKNQKRGQNMRIIFFFYVHSILQIHDQKNKSDARINSVWLVVQRL